MNKQKHCWYNLKIDITNCFLEGFKLPEHNGVWGLWPMDAKDIFASQWLEYMESIGFSVNSATVFYKGPYTQEPRAHIDIRKVEPLSLVTFGINWCYGGKNSEMVWYETPIEPTSVAYSGANTPYLSWDINDLKEIERTHIGNEVTIVRTNIPHGIKMDADPRWAISARFFKLKGAEWETIIEDLRKKNLLIER